MTYEETITYLYNSAPLYQQVGALAYKPGLDTTRALDLHFGHPHRDYSIIHIAGTNGKGSCSSTIAAVLQSAGYKVGLYTSPHLIDFRERIRVNGEMIPQQRVIDFVEKERSFFEPLHPSFFELTTALAFLYFSECKVDVAVIETGLGGRLDCTNIVTPIVSVITNISLDHTQYLGKTLQCIAAEKAGIIKKEVPVVIGEAEGVVRQLFMEKAEQQCSKIIFAEDHPELLAAKASVDVYTYKTRNWGELKGCLLGSYQEKNTNTILTVLSLLQARFNIQQQHVKQGFLHVDSMTGLQGRWQILSQSPYIVADAGHNEGGWHSLRSQLLSSNYGQLHIVLGMVSDKDIDGILGLLPQEGHYYFTKASVKRAINEKELLVKAQDKGLAGRAYPDVASAFQAALYAAQLEDMIFVGGSCFVVADFLTYWQLKNIE